MKEHMRMESHPRAVSENVLEGRYYRITVLTDSLLRLEYSRDGMFCNEPTQIVLNRDFPKTEFTVKKSDQGLEIRTKYACLHYDGKEFSSQGLFCECLQMGGGNRLPWRYGEEQDNLGGTARTLDGVNGACALEKGLLSRWCGCTVLDDSRSLLLGEDGWVKPAIKGRKDIYLFAYGHRYKEALKDFYRLCGKQPMLPRFALGNWWSRYYRYTEQSYRELMDRFERENLPFSVAVIDMDWHLVDIDPKYGTGWTGYTWNRELFPEPERFLQNLHERGMKTTLNLHPADGIRAFETAYPDMARIMGRDAQKEEPVLFAIEDPVFVEAYFEKVLRPLEEQGVDFWWIDWQQGTSSAMEGLDPLWMLNHYHYLDQRKEEKRPMTFSRYAGPGSHRYPVGFSGDSHITWESLRFQPEFTNTASNIGYGWWSHDIGGHMLGYKDDELEARWYQYGVFSPINRLHSSNSEFNGKEPWRFKKEARETMEEFLRLRHRLVPYLYTMNYRAWADDEPLCQPVYYAYPEEWGAYAVPNEYFFGSELLVVPVTEKRIQELNVAPVQVWLPEGLWFDFFTDTVYGGGKKMKMYRPLEQMPVLARAGAILPMTEQISPADIQKNPKQLTVRVYPGADNVFELYEDDNCTEAYKEGVCARTELRLDWNERCFSISPASGATELLPETRDWCVEFHKIAGEEPTVWRNGSQISASCIREGTTLCVRLADVPIDAKIEIRFSKETKIAENDAEKALFAFLNQAEIGFIQKESIYHTARKNRYMPEPLLSELLAADFSRDMLGIVSELCGQCAVK